MDNITRQRMSNDIPYSNRELDNHFQEIKDTLKRIETQTTKTNGRVSEIEVWKSTSIGWTTGVGVCIAIIISLVTYIFSSQLSAVQAQELEDHKLLEQHITAK